MSPKLSRLLVVAAVAAGFGVLPMQAAFADSGVDVYNPPTGFSNHANISGDCHGSNPADIPKTNIPIGASVNWYIKDFAGVRAHSAGRTRGQAPGRPPARRRSAG